MAKVIAAINMTLDGFCDHTSVVADEQLHEHYADVLSNAGLLIYGRTTYELMQYWQDLAKNPSGEQDADEFAKVMDRTPKLVFSRTLQSLDWHSATLATQPLETTVAKLKEELEKDIFIGSPGLIAALAEERLIDEYQLCIQPMIAGSGLPLFKNISSQIILELIHTKHFDSGALVLYYQPSSISE